MSENEPDAYYTSIVLSPLPLNTPPPPPGTAFPGLDRNRAIEIGYGMTSQAIAAKFAEASAETLPAGQSYHVVSVGELAITQLLV